MRGRFCKVSRPRQFVIDLMRASCGVPLITMKRTLDVGPLAAARAAALARPGWSAIFAKAFCLVARDEPILRTLYIKWPWSHFYQLPQSVGMIAVARCLDGEDCVLMQKVSAADEIPLAEVDAKIRHAQTAAIDQVPAFRRMMRLTRLPWPIRRLAWAFGLNMGRQHANYAGSYGITSVAAFGPGELYALSPGPFLISYGQLAPDHSIEVIVRWDHRVTDAAMIVKLFDKLERVLNGAIAAELRARPQITPPVRVVAH
ncbi:MAG TPA: acyltransferase [Rhodopseudomonas sp.]|uniref:acyltransferase n=1 Tax=Rhodopseudomonas sp. TaxID=1078 RepID=UPI002ED82592